MLKLQEAKEMLDGIRPWQAIAIACSVAALFSFYGPRWNDDVNRAAQLAVLNNLKSKAVSSCNDMAKENSDKVVFSAEKATFKLALYKLDDLPAVEVRQSGYFCFAPQDSDAQIGLDD